MFQKRSHQSQEKWHFHICAWTRHRRKKTVTMCLSSTQVLWHCPVPQKLKGKLTNPYNKGFFALNSKCYKDMYKKILEEYSQNVAWGFIFSYAFINDLLFYSGSFLSLFLIFWFVWVCLSSCILQDALA